MATLFVLSEDAEFHSKPYMGDSVKKAYSGDSQKNAYKGRKAKNQAAAQSGDGWVGKKNKI